MNRPIPSSPANLLAIENSRSADCELVRTAVVHNAFLRCAATRACFEFCVIRSALTDHLQVPAVRTGFGKIDHEALQIVYLAEDIDLTVHIGIR